MKSVNGFGLASLILGIIGILMTCLFGLGGIVGIIGLVFGILGLVILKDTPKGLAIGGVVVSSIACFLALGWFILYGLGVIGGISDNISSEKTNDTSTIELEPSMENEHESEMVASDDFGIDAEDVYNTIDTSLYESNKYFDVIEKGSYTNSIGSTILVHKVYGKKDVSMNAIVIAYDSEGNIIGKSEDDIVLSEDANNFFEFYFDEDISQATFDVSATPQSASLLSGDRRAVELISYNKSGNKLFLSFKQVSDYLSPLAKFRLIYYKDGKIIKTDEMHFSVYTDNLNGNGTTDVAEVWLTNTSFDSVEYFFEP